jgi:hypothetical protein
MNTRKILFSAIVLAAAIVVIVIVNVLSNAKPQANSFQFFPGISAQSLGSVTLGNASDQVKLLRRGDLWVVLPKSSTAAQPAGEGLAGSATETPTAAGAQAKPAGGSAAAEFPSDSAAISQLLETLLKIKKSTLVSENAAKQATFEVDSLHGTRIEAFDLAGKSLGAVILGKSSRDYGSNYFRPDNSNQVYLVPESNRYWLTADHKHWENKSILKFDHADVKQLTVAERGSPVMVIARGDSTAKGWQLVEGGKLPLDSNKVGGMLNTLSNLQAAEFEDSAYTDSATGLADPALKLTIAFKNGSSRVVAIGNEKTGPNEYWLKIPEKPFTYLINEWQFKQFNKKPEDLANVPPKPDKPGKPTPRPKTPGKIIMPKKK